MAVLLYMKCKAYSALKRLPLLFSLAVFVVVVVLFYLLLLYLFFIVVVVSLEQHKQT